MSKNSTIRKNNQQISLQQKIYYYITAAFLPNIFLFNLYNNNRDAQILFQHVIILGAVLAVISIVMLWSIRFVVRTYEGSLLLLFLFWITFWLFEFIHEVLPYQILNLLPINSRIILFVSITSVIIGVIVLLRLRRIRLYKRRVIFNVLSAVTCLLFIFNTFPSLIFAMSANSEEGRTFYIRREFNIDSSLPSPDIYWFHMDGMISLNSAEYYFDSPQDETRERLLDLGFVINENAEFGGGGTIFGVSALLSPDFYDSYLHEIFLEGEQLTRLDGRQELYNEAIERDAISFAIEIAPYHELFHAFLQAGYTATMIAHLSPMVYTPINQFYRLGSADYIDDFPFVVVDQTSEYHFLVDMLNLIELLVKTTPAPSRLINRVSGESDFDWQPISTYVDDIDRLTATTLNLLHERQLYRALIDHLETSKPNNDISTLTYITSTLAHASNWGHQVAGSRDDSRIDLYPLSYEYALHTMFNKIDMILEQNPNAVIVIQADHGMHQPDSQQALLDAGLTRGEVLHLFNSVISAVRIPVQYGGLDSAIDPINITRELVNRFVGENYQLLDQ